MQIAYHIGAPCTDDDRLVKSLLKNRAELIDDGIAVPPPSAYRDVIREAIARLDGAEASPEMRETVLDAILHEDDVDRLVLSHDKFICINRLVVQGAQIWPMIDTKARRLRRLFPHDEVEFYIGMRDPATLIPALFKASRFTDFAEFTENMQPAGVAWSETLMRLRASVPDAPVTVWCNEDTPLIWGELMYEISAADPMKTLEGQDDLLATIITDAGMKRMTAWLAEHPPETEMQRRRVVAAFLDKYAKEDEIEQEVDAPGWTQAAVDAMTAAYEEDMERVSRIDGVTFITP